MEAVMITFVQAIPGTVAPHPADASALGTLPIRGFRYCEPLRTASRFGYYCYLPLTLGIEYDGEGAMRVWLGEESLGSLEPGEGIQHPAYTRAWEQAAPTTLQRGLYPLVARSAYEPAMLQLWTGWLVRTEPEWGTLVRAPVNLHRPVGYMLYEGYIETDRWHGPLFANIAITKTDQKVTLRADWPVCQVQPLPRAAFHLDATHIAWGAWDDGEWARYAEHVVHRARDESRPRGDYAIRTRQRNYADGAAS
jgi:hypothetical protein